MSSLTVTLTGPDPATLLCVFFPPLELTGDERYVGMLDSFDVDFTKSEFSIGCMLGFTANNLLEANVTHESDTPVNIIQENTIRINYNIVQGYYKNGENDHMRHSFYPTVEPGFKIVETPANVIYLPVNVQWVDNIALSIVDQAGDIVNFPEETITVRLHLKLLP